MQWYEVWIGAVCRVEINQQPCLSFLPTTRATPIQPNPPQNPPALLKPFSCFCLFLFLYCTACSTIQSTAIGRNWSTFHCNAPYFILLSIFTSASNSFYCMAHNALHLVDCIAYAAFHRIVKCSVSNAACSVIVRLLLVASSCTSWSDVFYLYFLLLYCCICICVFV